MRANNLSNSADSAKTSQLSGKVALVTGGSRGIGKAIALSLAKEGASVSICARNRNELDASGTELKAIGNPYFISTCDVRSEDDVKKFVGQTVTKLGNIDILVNNAGVYRTEPLIEQSLANWQMVLDINLTGAMLFSREALKTMIARKQGSIVNISSVSGRTGEIWASAYSASKFGMIGLTQTLALEVAKDGITVNAICPGWVETEMTKEQLADPEWNRLNGSSSEGATDNACFAVPQNRFIKPEEVADLVVYLVSNQAKGITGQSINICGGLSLQ